MVAVSLRLGVQTAGPVGEHADQHLCLGVLLRGGRPAYRYGNLGQCLYSMRGRLCRRLSDRRGFGSFEFSGSAGLAVSWMRCGESVCKRSGRLKARFQKFAQVVRSRERDAPAAPSPYTGEDAKVTEMAGPNRISRVILRNYKSIRQYDVSLSSITFLVGPNGVGKSNFVEALRFLSYGLSSSLE